ncbi:hypothetical protein [Paenibacillus elgii]|uniref:hypothetical protein n=1 Tax=Paenibacillus elgii TaxID=189691 RepID=UPI0020414DD0|nr:hypothetical protein [Paenibacillus elgii]MCM3271559.1 hypothetical protein [Paenibacillus elgii]
MMSEAKEPNASWSSRKRIPGEEIGERLDSVRVLKEDGLELYEIAKDKATGEHYLHYAYLHRNLAAIPAGPEAVQEESFHHLMPLESDEVLVFLFGEASYDYPAHWSKPFLRNGPEGDYVWFDPGYAAAEAEHEAIGRDIAEQLALFKQAGDVSEQKVRELLERLNPGDSEKK